ncbi:MAG: hypothetical protein FWC65_04720 [Treponema sp.]|nr:hypothetical protein [Treponema sp.]
MQRHWFVTAFLWFLVFQGILSFAYLFTGYFIIAIPMILTCIAGILLLKWKISGFFIHCAACLFAIYLNTVYFRLSFSVAITACAIGIGVVYAVLKINKNGVSAWNHLMTEADRKRNNTKDQDAKAVPDFKEDVFYRVIKETPLNDSLSKNPKTRRMLRQDEKVIIKYIQNRADLGGVWVLVETETKDEGWCLFELLREI